MMVILNVEDLCCFRKSGAIATWGDALETDWKDGFQNGDNFIFLVFRDDVVYGNDHPIKQQCLHIQQFMVIIILK